MKQLLLGLGAFVVGTLAAISSANAGASCTDACTGPPGQLACGSVYLGCRNNQCVICETPSDCAPGGTCNAQNQCVGLICNPSDAGTGDAALTDNGGSPDQAAPPPDSDGDGVLDAVDNCPAAINPLQTDTDNDGMGDVCDTMPGDSGVSSDRDFDGVPDGMDNCPETPNMTQLDTDRDGIGDACEVVPRDAGPADTGRRDGSSSGNGAGSGRDRSSGCACDDTGPGGGSMHALGLFLGLALIRRRP